MNFMSFLNDLGIIPNKGTSYEKNPALNQGQEFMDFNRMYRRKEGKNLKALQVTSMPGIDSIVENMQNMRSSTSESKKSIVTKLENEFNKTLAEYDVVYRQFSEDILKSNARDKEIKKYFDEIITTGDGNYSYVNDYGFTQKYSTDAWSNNAENCPSDPMTVTKDLMSKFQQGSDMGIGQPCDVAGKNIQNEDTKEYAWVDIKGKKHIYSDKLWKNKNENCNIPAVSLSAKDYDSIPSGGNMTNTNTCMQLKVDPKIWNKMNMLNNKMEKLAKEMIVQLDDLVIEDVELNAAMLEQKNKLNNYIARIDKDRNQINFYNQNYVTVMAEHEDSHLREVSTRYHYIAWVLVAITIFALMMHNALNPNSNTTDTVVVVIGIIFIFIVCRAIYNRYYYLL